MPVKEHADGTFCGLVSFGVDGDRTRTGVCFSSFSLGRGPDLFKGCTPAIPTRPLVRCVFFLLFSSLHFAIFHTLVTLIVVTRAPGSLIPTQRLSTKARPGRAALKDDLYRCFHHCLLFEGSFDVYRRPVMSFLMFDC